MDGQHLLNRAAFSGPHRCDLCGFDDCDVIVDGRTRRGFWAWMCEVCHREQGVGLGTGKGQKWSTWTGKKLAG